MTRRHRAAMANTHRPEITLRTGPRTDGPLYPMQEPSTATRVVSLLRAAGWGDWAALFFVVVAVLAMLLGLGIAS